MFHIDFWNNIGKLGSHLYFDIKGQLETSEVSTVQNVQGRLLFILTHFVGALRAPPCSLRLTRIGLYASSFNNPMVTRILLRETSSQIYGWDWSQGSLQVNFMDRSVRQETLLCGWEQFCTSLDGYVRQEMFLFSWDYFMQVWTNPCDRKCSFAAGNNFVRVWKDLCKSKYSYAAENYFMLSLDRCVQQEMISSCWKQFCAS